MDEDEKPLTTRFWTGDMLALLGLNIVFIVLIIVGLWLIGTALYPPFLAWLKNVIHI